MMLSKLKIKIFHLWFLIVRPMTMGVRVVVTDGRGYVLLVRHTYIEGWHLPGGGIETGETAEAAAHKELLEEAGLALGGQPKLFGVYANRNASKRDHVLLYLCDEWYEERVFTSNKEIAEIGFFKLDELPDKTTSATRRRLGEVFDNHLPAEFW